MKLRFLLGLAFVNMKLNIMEKGWIYKNMLSRDAVLRQGMRGASAWLRLFQMSPFVTRRATVVTLWKVLDGKQLVQYQQNLSDPCDTFGPFSRPARRDSESKRDIHLCCMAQKL